uniref:Uncharacterized protein n=1 Tax=Triticum urartu TaxID=4572 RepID=A0A8R7UT32_TRIUA
MEAGEVVHPATEHDSSEYWLRRFPTPNLGTRQWILVMRADAYCLVWMAEANRISGVRFSQKKKWGKEHAPHGPDELKTLQDAMEEKLQGK